MATGVEARVSTLADQFQPGTFVDALRFIVDNIGLLLRLAAEQLELAFVALAIGLVLALPLGLWLGHKHRGLFFAASVSNVGRALPSIVLIAFGLAIFGLGFWNNALALSVLAIPPILTNTYFAIDGVDSDVVEAARGMGLSERQVLTQVELPLGLPLVIAGIRIATIFVIATATIASIAGGHGLGDIMVNQTTYGLSGVVGASLCVSLLAFSAAFLLTLLYRAVSPRPVPSD
jgi:osmoprotectant transport system permease protein